MTRKDEVNTGMEQLLDAVLGDREHEAMRTAVVLVGGMMIDLARIADAVEKLATYEGDTALDEASGARVTLMGLTTEEADTIEALRRGDIVVTAPDQPTPWKEWLGVGQPNVEPHTLVDVRFRQPSRGDRVPDLIGVQAASVGWQNTGRPTNADVVAWRISDEQATGNN